MLAPLPGEPKGWWTQLQSDELVAWAGRVDDEARVRLAARDERDARAERVRLGEAIRACRMNGHRLCGGRLECVHPAFARDRAGRVTSHEDG